MNSVESLDVRDDGSILSGDWDGRLCLWSTNNSSGVAGMKDDDANATSGGGESLSSLKKRKVGGSSVGGGGSSSSSSVVKEFAPVAAFKAHAQCVSGVRWMVDTADAASTGGGICANAVTSSWDHSLKSWDVERQDCITTINGSKVRRRRG
jgi:ribosome biogenesis protein YTM1